MSSDKPYSEKPPKDGDLDRQKRKLRRQVQEKQRNAAPGLRPDDIGVVRVEFSVPASRLFGPGGLTTGDDAGGRTVDNDGDPNDDILIFDNDMGPNGDPVLQVPWPPLSDPD